MQRMGLRQLRSPFKTNDNSKVDLSFSALKLFGSDDIEQSSDHKIRIFRLSLVMDRACNHGWRVGKSWLSVTTTHVGVLPNK